jgi:hypothetical protein
VELVRRVDRMRDPRFRRARRSVVEGLESRRMLHAGVFSQYFISGGVTHDFDSAGVTTDATGHLWVSSVAQYLGPIYADIDQTEELAVYNPIPGAPPIASWPVGKEYNITTPGSLVTLDANSVLGRLGGLREGDLLNLLPDGRIFAVRPGTDLTQQPQIGLVMDIRYLTSPAVAPDVFAASINHIYDIQ